MGSTIRYLREYPIINPKFENNLKTQEQRGFTLIWNTHLIACKQNTAKQEIQIEDLKRKLEKNQQQMNNRLNEIDSSLEKIHSTQVCTNNAVISGCSKRSMKLFRFIFKQNTNTVYGSRVQESVQKDIRKFNTLVTSVAELTENSKTEASKLVQTLNSSQQQLRQEFTVNILNRWAKILLPVRFETYISSFCTNTDREKDQFDFPDENDNKHVFNRP